MKIRKYKKKIKKIDNFIKEILKINEELSAPFFDAYQYSDYMTNAEINFIKKHRIFELPSKFVTMLSKRCKSLYYKDFRSIRPNQNHINKSLKNSIL